MTDFHGMSTMSKRHPPVFLVCPGVPAGPCPIDPREPSPPSAAGSGWPVRSRRLGWLAWAVVFVVVLGRVTPPARALETSCTGSACCLNDFSPGANCTANDLTFVLAGLGVMDDGCVDANDTVSILLRGIIENSTAQTRYDIGVWIATDGDPNNDGAKTGVCAREILFNPSGVLDSQLCTDLDLTCGAGAYYDADLDACGDLIEGAPDCGQVDDPTISTDGPCTTTDMISDASVLDFAQPVVFACNDSDVDGPDGFANIDICLSYGNQPNQVDFGGANSQCDNASEIEPGTNAKCQCEDNFNTNIPAPDLSLSCTCAGTTMPGGFSTCTVSYASTDLAGCVPDPGTQERFRCGAAAYIRFAMDYDQANLSIASATTASGSASDNGDVLSWNPESGAGTANIIGEGDSGSLTVRFDVDAMASLGTYDTTVATLWSNGPGFGASSTQTLSATCSFAVAATWATVAEVWAETTPGRDRRAATAPAGDVVLRWRTAGEAETLGFEVERWLPAAGRFEPVAETMVVALGDGPGGEYALHDPAADGSAGPLRYRLIEHDRRGGQRIHGPYTVVPRPVPTEERAELEGMSWTAPRTQRESERRRREPNQLVTTAGRPVGGAGLATGRVSRMAVEVEDDGLVHLGAGEIATTLAVDPIEVRSALAAGRWRLSEGGRAVAYRALEGGEGLEFWGRGLDSIYTRANVYWLEPGPGTLVEELGGQPPQSTGVAASFTETLRREEDLLPRIGVASDPESDYWFWSFVITGHPTYGHSELSFDLPSVAPGSTEGLLAVDLWGFDAGPHRAEVWVNGALLGEIAWSGAVPHRGTVALPQTVLLDGSNTVVLEGLEGTWFVDGFDFVYQRRFEALDDTLLLRGDGAPRVTVEGFTHPDLEVWELADPRRPRRLGAVAVEPHDGGFRATFEPGGADVPYIVVAAPAITGPSALRRDRPSRWLASGHGADYLVISPTVLLDGAKAFAAYRAADGLASEVVDLQDIYDEVSDGIATPEAVRAFLALISERWSPVPRYVLLLGDGHYDYRGLQQPSGNLLPPLMVPTAFGLVPADNRFADPGDALGVPRMAVGRVPALSVDEALAYLEKIEGWEGAGGDWRQRVLFTADNTDYAGEFASDAGGLADALRDQFRVEETYLLAPYSLPEARQRIRDTLNEGVLLLGYAGHGGIDRLAAEGLVLADDVPALVNGERLPVVSAASCYLNFFAFPGFDSLGEDLVLSSNGGAAAVFSASGLSAHSEAVHLTGLFHDALLLDRRPRIGDAMLKALQGHAASGGLPEMVSLYNLLGDPALKVPYPE